AELAAHQTLRGHVLTVDRGHWDAGALVMAPCRDASSGAPRARAREAVSMRGNSAASSFRRLRIGGPVYHGVTGAWLDTRLNHSSRCRSVPSPGLRGNPRGQGRHYFGARAPPISLDSNGADRSI